MNSIPVRLAPIPFRVIPSSTIRTPRACILSKWLTSRSLATNTPLAKQDAVPLRLHLKDEAKRKKAAARTDDEVEKKTDKWKPDLEKWEVVVGIEIHAELNTACKLFSSAPAAFGDADAVANSNVALFDAAMPGTQPQFQLAALLPALRAAIALECEIQPRSGWDRKHYFHWDQPNGYQITQYYEPFAKKGRLMLTVEDGVPADEMGSDAMMVHIKQIQMEQDTAKTTSLGPSTHHIDLNRAGHPLIEIITDPHMNSPQSAAAVVRKIQAILKSVDACTTGMELGGLRADVNVSVRERDSPKLGQRTEIKNLSSFKAVEDAVAAERDRQIFILENGGVIEGETRGWTLGATETTRLRGKEGEVDYRYMPDPDLPPLYIGQELVDELARTMPELPDETIKRVQEEYDLSLKDAKTIVSLDDGDRLEFLEETCRILFKSPSPPRHLNTKTVGNWVLHELGGLPRSSSTSWSDMSVTPQELADLLICLDYRQITARAAKQLLAILYNTPSSAHRPTVDQLIDEGNLRLRPLSDEDYTSLAQQIMNENPKTVTAIKEKGQTGKTQWFVGQMVRRAEEGTVEPEKALEIVRGLLGIKT